MADTCSGRAGLLRESWTAIYSRHESCCTGYNNKGRSQDVAIDESGWRQITHLTSLKLFELRRTAYAPLPRSSYPFRLLYNESNQVRAMEHLSMPSY